jgi:hypothetical protein
MHTRFDAETVVRLATFNESSRFEMQFRDSDGKEHVVSLPLPVAVELGCLICEVSERAPFVTGGIQSRRSAKK